MVQFTDARFSLENEAFSLLISQTEFKRVNDHQSFTYVLHNSEISFASLVDNFSATGHELITNILIKQ